MPPKKRKKPHVHNEATLERMTKAQQLREHFVQLVADGMTVTDATKAVNRSIGWYENARHRHPEWAHRVTSVRLARADAELPGMDFVNFRKTYFNNRTFPHHYRMVEAFEHAKPGSTTVCLAFPGAGKTTLLTDMYSFLLAEDPNQRICVISEGQDLSRKIIGQVSDRMSDRERFLAYHLRYGPFRARAWDDNNREDRDPIKRPWTADYFKILAADADEKDPSLECRGASGRLYGGRYDWMVFDDVQSNESLGNTDKLLQSMRTTWQSRTILAGKERGKTVMIGSRVGPGDIYEKMDEEGMIDHLITIPALTEHVPRDEHFTVVNGKVIVNPNCAAQPTWDLLSLEDLAKIRKTCGEEVWARTYMQDIVVEASQVFTDEMIEAAKDHHRSVGPSGVGMDVWCSIDPALDSGRCAYLSAAFSPDRLHILDSLSVADTHSYNDIYDRVRAWKVKYRPSMWVVEENNFQKGMLQDDRLLSAARPAFVEAHRTGRNKNDNVMGIRMMANAFADGEIRIPWADERSRNTMQPLIDELRKWRPNKRGAALQMDRVMSLWFIWLRWQVERQSLGRLLPMQPRPSWVSKAG